MNPTRCLLLNETNIYHRVDIRMKNLNRVDSIQWETFRGISGIFRSDVRPFLVRELDKESIKIDCNHPLARKALKLELRIEAIESIFQERGGE